MIVDDIYYDYMSKFNSKNKSQILERKNKKEKEKKHYDFEDYISEEEDF